MDCTATETATETAAVKSTAEKQMTFDSEQADPVEHQSSCQPLLEHAAHNTVSMISPIQLPLDLKLLDFSSNKKYLAYVTNDYKLFIHKIADLDNTSVAQQQNKKGLLLYSEPHSIHNDISAKVKWEVQDDCMIFLSVSNDGNYAIISFQTPNQLRDEEFFSKRKKEYNSDTFKNRQKRRNDNKSISEENHCCILYTKDTIDKSKIILHSSSKINSKGRAYFVGGDQPGGAEQLVVDCGRELCFYNTAKFKIDYKYGIDAAQSRITQKKQKDTIITSSNVGGLVNSTLLESNNANTSCNKKSTSLLEKYNSQAASSLLNRRILVTSGRENNYITEEDQESDLKKRDEAVQLWSIYDGTLAGKLSLQEPEQILNISNNSEYVVTINLETGCLQIYNVMSTLMVFVLETSGYVTWRRNTLKLCNAHFCFNLQYLLVATYDEDEDENKQATITYTVWNIEEERVIVTSTINLPKAHLISELLPIVIEKINPFNELPDQLIIFNTIDLNDDLSTANRKEGCSIKGYSIQLQEKDCGILMDGKQQFVWREHKIISDGITVQSSFLHHFLQTKSRSIFELPKNSNDILSNYVACSIIKAPKKSYALIIDADTTQLLEIAGDCDGTIPALEDLSLVYIKKHPTCLLDLIMIWLLPTSETNTDGHKFCARIKFVKGAIETRAILEFHRLNQTDAMQAPPSKVCCMAVELLLPISISQADTNCYKRNLHYISGVYGAYAFLLDTAQRKYSSSEVYKAFFRQTHAMVEETIAQMDNKSIRSYFMTPGGIDALASISSSEFGLEILKKVVSAENIEFMAAPPIGLDNNMQSGIFRPLIRGRHYQLFNLVINRIIKDSERLGCSGYLFPLVNVLLLLQEDNYSADVDYLLTHTSKKLSYVRLSPKDINWSEIFYITSILNSSPKPSEHDYKLRYLQPIASVEQLKKKTFLSELVSWVLVKIEHLQQTEPSLFIEYIFWEFKNKTMHYSDVMCVVPLPFFSSYTGHSQEQEEYYNNNQDDFFQNAPELDDKQQQKKSNGIPPAGPKIIEEVDINQATDQDGQSNSECTTIKNQEASQRQENRSKLENEALNLNTEDIKKSSDVGSSDDNQISVDYRFNNKDKVEHSDGPAVEDEDDDRLFRPSLSGTEGQKTYRMLKTSHFTRLAYYPQSQMLHKGETIMLVLLRHKWKKFAHRRFLQAIIPLIIANYICFSTGVAFAEGVYNYKPGTPITDPGHIASILIMCICCAITLYQEWRQLKNNITAYFRSLFYNIFDIASAILPIVGLLLLRYNPSYHMYEVNAPCILIFWLQFISKLRVYRPFGKTLEIIIQLSKKVIPTICIFTLIIAAFTNAFVALLYKREDGFFQEQYSGESVNSTQSSITMNDASTSNDFKNVFKAFVDVWFMVYGIWDPLKNGNAGDDVMIQIMAVVFSFITILIFLNMLIALMSSTVEKVKADNDALWLRHLTALVSEIETIWCTEQERISRLNNPSWIYYMATQDEYNKQKDFIEEDNKKMKEELEKSETVRSDNFRIYQEIIDTVPVVGAATRRIADTPRESVAVGLSEKHNVAEDMPEEHTKTSAVIVNEEENLQTIQLKGPAKAESKEPEKPNAESIDSSV